jgi:hypothetical protein
MSVAEDDEDGNLLGTNLDEFPPDRLVGPFVAATFDGDTEPRLSLVLVVCWFREWFCVDEGDEELPF